MSTRPISTLPLLLLIAVLDPSLALGATGGPDSFGYTWADNRSGCSATTPVFGGGETRVNAAAAPVGPVDLGFRMPFFGSPVTQIWISPQGYVSFSPQAEDPNPVEIVPGGAGPNHFLAPLWASGVTNADILYEVTLDGVHVKWILSGASQFAFVDLIFSPDGSFRIHWQSNWIDAAVGYRDVTGARAHTLYYNGLAGTVHDGAFPTPTTGSSMSACITAPELLDCSGEIPIACGESRASSLPGTDPSPAGGYLCTADPLEATERVFTWTVTEPARGAVWVDDPSLDLLLLSDGACSENSCVAHSAPGTGRLDLESIAPGVHRIVVDAPAAGTVAAFNLSVDCSPDYPDLECGLPHAGDTSGSTNAVQDYPGLDEVLDGPEVLHHLLVPEQGPLSAVLSGAGPDAWVVIRPWDFSAVLAAGAGGASVADVPPGEYAVLVDSVNGAAGAYELSVSCGAALDCSMVEDVSCAETVRGDTSLGAANVATYTCASDLLEGKELAYRLFNPLQRTISARFVSSQPGQRLLLLAGCSEGACRLYGQTQVSCARLPAGEYYLVVDSPPGSEGAFEIEIECSDFTPGLDVAVTSIDASALTGTCREFDVSGVARVALSNLGTVAVPAPFDVVVFEDDPLSADGLYDPAVDNVLGSATVMSDIPAGFTTFLDVPSAGILQFRDNAIYAIADPDRVLAGDVNRTNDLFDTGRGCLAHPEIGVFEPVVEWWWQGSTVLPTYVEVDTIPLVGDVNADGHPDVVIVTGPEQFNPGVVRVLDGRDGSEIWTATAPEVAVWASSNLALGELDGDPGLEIIGHSSRDLRTLVAIDDDGSFLWQSPPLINHPITNPAAAGGGWAPSIADLNCDGRPEVVVGANVFDAVTGALFWTPENGGTRGINGAGDGALSVVVDVDGDGTMEVIAGPTCYQYDPLTGMGRILWHTLGLPDGTPAVGNFDEDDAPEVAITGQGMVYVLDADTGALLWQRNIPFGGGGCAPPAALAGGPPTVADFDGDCQAEVGVAGADWYTVFETDGSLKWQAPIFDCSSHRTASTVFDFDGDGAAEVAFMDEQNLHIFRGRDGAEIVRVQAGSHTWIEMISIADVDGDNNAEIIMPLNPCFAGGACDLTGVQVIGDLNDNWVNTRRIWNQHAYHVNNVNDDGTIPPAPDGPGFSPCEVESWLRHNTYRDQLLGSAVFLAPDLTLSILETELTLDDDCFRTLRLVARVGNGGGLSVGSAVLASFYDSGPGGDVLLDNVVLPDLRPGEFGDFEILVPAPRFGELTVVAVADDDGSGRGVGFINECREDNNSCSVTIDNTAGEPVGDPPPPVGPALRATAHGLPGAALVTGDFNWALDEGLPRAAGEHYHVLRGTDPQVLTQVSGHPLDVSSWVDSTPRAVNVPLVHFLKVVAADRCEQVEQAPDGP